MEKNKTYSIDKSPLYRLSNRKKILELFGVESYTILEGFRDDNNYEKFPQKSKNGKIRNIENPTPDLKKFLKKFNNLLQKIEVPDYVKAGKKGSSYVSNGYSHKDGLCFNCADISDFYPSTRKNKLYQTLLYHFEMTPDIAGLFTEILTCEAHLPTGSPSSQLLAYWTYKDTFDSIYNYARGLNINMTLFVDDMTFSSKNLIPKDFVKVVDAKLINVGLKIKDTKTKKYNAKGFKIVTGVCVTPDNKIKVPNRLRYKIVQLRDKGLSNLSDKEIESLKGFLNAARQIEPNFFNNFYTAVLAL